MKKILAAALLLFTFSLPLLADETPTQYVKVDTNYGSFVLGLYGSKAPRTVENFLQYVNSGFYTGTIFHRVVPGFVVQGGGYTKDFKRKPTQAPIYNEAKNGLSNLRGTVAMARTLDPNSATSQFYINLADNTDLDYRSDSPSDYGYTVFGKVVSGMEVIDKIAELTTGPGGHFQSDVPISPVIITKISLTAAPPAAAATH